MFPNLGPQIYVLFRYLKICPIICTGLIKKPTLIKKKELMDFVTMHIEFAKELPITR